MAWEVEVSDEFAAWYDDLDEGESDHVDVAISLLEEYGPSLGRPYADTIRQSRYPNMKELRVQHEDVRIASCLSLTRAVRLT